MGTFIADGAAVLPDVKTDARAPTGATTEWAAEDANEVRTALLDLRSYSISYSTAVAAEAAVRAAADALIIASGDTPADVGIAPVTADATGATTPRTVAQHFGDTIDLKDAGCVCDGVTNDYAALAALVTALGSSKKTVVVSGNCHTHSDVFFPQNILIRFEGNGSFSGPGVVSYGCIAIMPASSGSVTATAPVQFHFNGGQAAGEDQVFSIQYNNNLTTGLPYDDTQPSWSEQWESRFAAGAPPLGLMERITTYTSIDRTVSYRPWQYVVNLNDHKAAAEWRCKLFEIYGRGDSIAALVVRTGEFSGTPEYNSVVVNSQGSSPFNVTGGAGSNVAFNLASGGMIMGLANVEATVGTPLLDGVGFFSQGKYWNGAASANANSYFQTTVQSATKYRMEFATSSGARLYLNSGGSLELPWGHSIRMQSDNGKYWDFKVSDAGAWVSTEYVP